MADIMVLTAGSTGDVQPFAALAARLAARGHDVALAADPAFRQRAVDDGIRFTPVRADFQSLLPTSERRRPSLRQEVLPVIRGMLEDSWEVAQALRPDLIVAHEKTLAAPHLAEKLRVPYLRALTVPMLTPTREFPLPAVVRRNLGGVLNRASYRLVAQLTRPYAGLIRDWRARTLALAPRGTPPSAARTLYCYSPSLVPTPTDWPRDVVATGPWVRGSASADQAVDPELARFVAEGTAPVYIGFGSSVGRDPDRLGSAVGEAVRRAGTRAVIATGWGGIQGVQSGTETAVVDAAPHEWLFSRVAAVVHHGGAGTTAAGLLAGRPTVVCPFQGDQHFWGAAVRRAGAGPEPVAVRRLTPERLGAAIRAAIHDQGLRAGAADLASRMGAEDGTARASEQIEDIVASS